MAGWDMDWLFKMFEKGLFKLGDAAGDALATAGENTGEHVSTDRIKDKLTTARMMRGDKKELYNEYERLLKYRDQAKDICNDLSRFAMGKAAIDAHSQTEEIAHQLCQEILTYEGYFPLTEIDFTRNISLGDIWKLTETVQHQLDFYENKANREEIGKTLSLFVKNLLPRLDATDTQGVQVGFVPLVRLLPDPVKTLDGLISFVAAEAGEDDNGLISRLGKQIRETVMVISGIDPEHDEPGSKQFIMPSAHKDKYAPEQLVKLYLKNTPFVDFFNIPLPFTIPLRTRFAHMHIVGGSGHGKTQTLQNLFLTDLEKVGRGERTVIVIDSQGDLIHNILKLEAVGDILDRVVLIYPKDIKHPPALNLFDFGLDRLQEYNDAEREMLVNGAISLYEYMFGAILGAELTAKQGVIFGYLARLLLTVPGATIDTLIDFLEEPETVRPFLAKLDHPLTRRFFERQFFNNSFDDTRQQILYRIYHVLQSGTLARMFRNKRNKVNLFEAMNRGSLILIHTAKDLLKQEGCEILGRFFISLITQAAQERAALPLDRRTPTFVYIDEAHDYFDENIENLLEQARKFQVGLILAHQHLDQFEGRLRSAVSTNTAIKMVGGLSAKDASELSKDMGCSPEFLLSMRKYESEKISEFACFVKDSINQAVRLGIPLGIMEEQPKIHPQMLKALLQRNRERYCTNDSDDYPPDTPDDSPLGDPDLL